jgi:hypothetical protein
MENESVYLTATIIYISSLIPDSMPGPEPARSDFGIAATTISVGADPAGRLQRLNSIVPESVESGGVRLAPKH